MEDPAGSWFLFAFVSAYLAVLAARLVLRGLNLRHLREHGTEVPRGFEGRLSPDVLRRTRDYTLANARLALLESLTNSALLLWFLVGGWLGVYSRWVAGVFDSQLAAGVVFFLGLHYAHTALNIPFQLYHTFRLEERHGFNRTTPGLWLADLLKSELVSTVLLAVLAATGIGLIRWSPDHWWLWFWLFFSSFSVFLMYIAPYVIEPLFFNFEPIAEEDLKQSIREMMQRVGLSVSRVLKVDASRRSTHSNAYFTGIGRVKRIVLFDTLLEQMNRSEILAILAHEAGHWKLRHLFKRLAGSLAAGLAVLYAAQHLLHWNGLSLLVGEPHLALPARLVVLSLLGSLLMFPLTPLSSWLSRRHEWQSDDFARQLAPAPGALASALVKLARENLANLHPHPLYAWFYYSHPPVVDRVRRLLGEPEGS